MKEIKSIQEMRSYSNRMHLRGKTIGFVPTMGYLHEGHLSLVEAARKKADIVVVSIFVNPIQFGPQEDFRDYPRDLKRDKKLLKHFNVDVIFHPSASQMFPEGFKTQVEVEKLSNVMCGRPRPNHFRGVATVVTKLFNIVQPDFAFFGEKDYQQQLIIKQMVKDLNLAVEIIALPTIREFDGLAMSSRNTYLSPQDRKTAVALYQALSLAKKEIQKGEKDPKRILLQMRSFLGTKPKLRLDYATIADPETLEEVKSIDGKVLVALAAYIGKTRLIDNLVITP